MRGGEGGEAAQLGKRVGEVVAVGVDNRTSVPEQSRDIVK